MYRFTAWAAALLLPPAIYAQASNEEALRKMLQAEEALQKPLPPAPPSPPALDPADLEVAVRKAMRAVEALSALPGVPPAAPAPPPVPGLPDAFEYAKPFFLAQAAPVRIEKGISERERGRRDIERASRAYARGTRELDRRNWQEAISSFDEVIQANSNRADGALYWKAYALNKLGKREEALATLDTLQRQFPSSRWLNDAKALSVEVHEAAGKPVSPDDVNDEDLKILALNSLLQTDPERVVPAIEKLLKGSGSPRVKERALFVLAQSPSPKARNVLAAVAQGGANPDLQIKAVEYLGIHGGKNPENRKTLSDVYSGTNDVNVKQAVLRSFMIARDTERLMAAAKSESSAELREYAINMLGSLKAQEELWQLYQAESSPEIRARIVQGLFISGDTKRVLEIARQEKAPEVRREAVYLLANMKSVDADSLLSLYSADAETSVRRAIIHGLASRKAAKPLIDIARKETNAELKREAVHALSRTKSPEATEFLMELLNK